jgi:hypothetical protein
VPVVPVPHVVHEGFANRYLDSEYPTMVTINTMSSTMTKSSILFNYNIYLFLNDTLEHARDFLGHC